MSKIQDTNFVLIVGRLTKDPILANTPQGTNFVKFTLANNKGSDKEGNERDANFFDCIAWKGTAEKIVQYLNKGSKVLIQGYIEQQKWDDKETGKHRSRVELVSVKVTFLDGQPSRESKQDNIDHSSESDREIESENFGDPDVLPY